MTVQSCLSSFLSLAKGWYVLKAGENQGNPEATLESWDLGWADDVDKGATGALEF